MISRFDDDTGVTISYSWDSFNKLVAVSSADSGGPTNDAKQENSYLANGFRRKKKAKSGAVTTEYSAGLSTAMAKVGSDPISYIQGHHILGFERGGQFYWYLTDALGSVRDIVSGTDGAVLQSYDYRENGEKTATTSFQSDKTWIGGLSVNDDTADSGLYLMGHRHYDSSLGRFLSRDPIGFAGGLNLYEYAGSSPVGMVDPEGLNPGTMGFRPSVAVGIGLEDVGGTGALDLSIGLQAINNSYTEGRMFVKVEGFDDPIILGKDGKARYGRDTTPEEIDLFMAGGRGDRMRDTPCPPAGHRFSLTDLPSSSSGPWHKSGGKWPDHAIFQFGLGNLYHSPTNPRYNRIRISVSFIGTAVFSDTSVGPVRPAGRSMTHEFRIEGPVRDVRHGEL